MGFRIVEEMKVSCGALPVVITIDTPLQFLSVKMDYRTDWASAVSGRRSTDRVTHSA